MKTLAGRLASVPEKAVEELTATMRGPVLKPEDDGYDEARVVQNGRFDCRPALIVRCSGAADVRDAVRFAGTHGLLTASAAKGTVWPATASRTTL